MVATLTSKAPFTHPQNPAGLFLSQPSLFPFIPGFRKTHLPVLLQHVRSVHNGPCLEPL